jgi:hypothetical protein
MAYNQQVIGSSPIAPTGWDNGKRLPDTEFGQLNQYRRRGRSRGWRPAIIKAMTHQWSKKPASAVQPGDRVRTSGNELTVFRIESPFMGVAGMIAFIEDTPERWIKRPVQADSEVEVLIPD